MKQKILPPDLKRRINQITHQQAVQQAFERRNELMRAMQARLNQGQSLGTLHEALDAIEKEGQR